MTLDQSIAFIQSKAQRMSDEQVLDLCSTLLNRNYDSQDIDDLMCGVHGIVDDTYAEFRRLQDETQRHAAQYSGDL